MTLRHALAVTLLLISRLSLYAQQEGVAVFATPAARSKAIPQGSVLGHVTFQDTHGPARSARVMIVPTSALRHDKSAPASMNNQPMTAITRVDGSFAIFHVPPGEYLVIGLAAGYLSPLDAFTADTANPSPDEQKAMEKQILATAPSVNVTGGAAATVEVELQRGAALSGRVIYADGSAAGQMPVMLQAIKDDVKSSGRPVETFNPGAFIRGYWLQQSLSTDDLGHFRLSGIPSGSYRLAVPESFDTSSMQEQIFSFMSLADTKGRLVVYSGSTLHKKDAKVYTVQPGDTIDDIEIVLPISGLHSIHGVATSRDGAPLTVGEVDLTDTADDSISFHTTVQAGGEISFVGVPEGTYTLKIAGGGIFEDLPPDPKIPEQQRQFMPPQQKQVRAFADTSQSVLVKDGDIDDLTIALADTKLPDPAPAQPDNAPDE
jgi:hypothetical protein